MSALSVNWNVADAPTGIPPLGLPPPSQSKSDELIQLAITERVDVDVHTTGGEVCGNSRKWVKTDPP